MSIHDFNSFKQLLHSDTLPDLATKLATGNYRSGYMLGLYYLDENHRDINVALGYLHGASRHGITEAMTVLGDIYSSGDFGVERNYNVAIDYYKMAADLGDFFASRELAIIYAAQHAVNGSIISLRMAESYARKVSDMGYVDIYNTIFELSGVRIDNSK